MQFLQQPLSASLAEGGSTHTTFVAEIFSGRPPFDEICGFSPWVERAQADLDRSLLRPACPVQGLAIYLDTLGSFMLVRMKGEAQNGNAKSAVMRALKELQQPLPAEQRRRVADTFRPLDQLDKERLEAMRTVHSLRKSPKEDTRPTPATLVALVASLSDSESEDEGQRALCALPPPGGAAAARLALVAEVEETGAAHAKPPSACEHVLLFWSAAPRKTCSLCGSQEAQQCQACGALLCKSCADHPAGSDGAAGQHEAALAKLEAFDHWQEAAQCLAAVVVAQAGETKKLTYVRCRHEPRRAQLIAKRLSADCSFVEAVRIAVAMAKEGMLPLAEVRQRKGEFLKRCGEALRSVRPSARVSPRELPPSEQRALALALDTTERACHRCARPAECVVTAEDMARVCAMTLGWRVESDTELPEVCGGKIFCVSCAMSNNIAVCQRCGRDDALATSGDDGPMPAWPKALPYHVRFDLVCTKCGVHPSVANAANRVKRPRLPF